MTPSRPGSRTSASDRRGRAAYPSSAGNTRGGARGRDGWREFGNRVREFTGRMPLVGRVAEYGRRQRNLNREWEEWDNSSYDASMSGPAPHAQYDPYAPNDPYNDVPGLPPPYEGDSMPGGYGMAGPDSRSAPKWGPPGASGKQGKRGGQIRLMNRNFSIRLVAVLALLSVVVGFCCTQSTLTLVDAASAAADAKAQVTAIEGILKGGNVTDTEHLTELQTRLTALNGDLVRVQGSLGLSTHLPIGGSVNHMLTMATSLVQAGHYGVDAALVLLPHLKGVFSDIGKSASGAPGATPGTTPAPSPTATAGSANSATGGLTMDEVTRAQQDITTAGTLAQQALAERQYINEGQLSGIGLGSIVTILHKMDAIAPKLPTYLGYANSVMTALPNLLGLTKPAHFLLFDMDSDEMRPSGGFMGNFALITVQNGRLVGGVHLRDTASFDCPAGQHNCPWNPIPSQYGWMNAFPDHFGMRDANISPDFPTSAKLVEQLYQQEGGQPVDGVIMMTPEIIKDILKVTGPISVEGFQQSVNSTNLQDVIHYYHILYRNATQNVGGTSIKKAIDSLLGSALLHKVGTLSAAQQSALMKSILGGFSTKDLQVYFNDPKMEAVLAGLHMDSAIPMPTGTDGLMVTDTNTGATYYNRDMQESVVDTITFDSQGNAIHDMTLTYKLPVIQHMFTPIYVQGNGSPITWYTGITRVIVPDGSTAINGTQLFDGSVTAMQVDQSSVTCTVEPAPEAGHVVWASRIDNLQTGPNSIVVFHMKWTTPKVLKAVNGKLQYSLQLYRQAGNNISYDIKIVPPKNDSIAQMTSPLKAAASPKGAAEFTSPAMTKDTLLTLTFSGG